ncbi:MAG: hypothetical protein ACRCWF_17730 [Beijerinckiaceae bacterium]
MPTTYTVIKSTGMVPVRIIDASRLLTGADGDLLGLAPLQAHGAINSGIVEPANAPEGLETVQVEAVTSKTEAGDITTFKEVTAAPAKPAAPVAPAPAKPAT